LPLGRSSAGRRLRFNFRLLAVLLAAIVESGCWEGTTRETLATVLAIDGAAEISADGGRTFPSLHPAQTAGKGAILRTSSAGTVSLTLLPNSVVHLDADTSLEILRIALIKDGNETANDVRGRFAEIRLIGGRVFVSHVWGEAQARLSVATPNGEVSTPSNAAFWVEVAEGKTRVTCVSGWTEFRPSDAATSTRIRPGWISQWPSAGENLSPADADARGQEDIQHAIKLEQQMRELLSQKRNVLPR
jgi:hypothetical protein